MSKFETRILHAMHQTHSFIGLVAQPSTVRWVGLEHAILLELVNMPTVISIKIWKGLAINSKNGSNGNASGSYLPQGFLHYPQESRAIKHGRQMRTRKYLLPLLVHHEKS